MNPFQRHWLVLGIILALLIALCSCSSNYHYQRIIKKDPTFFRVDTVTQIEHIPIPTITTPFECPGLKSPIQIIEIPVYIPRADGSTRADTATLTITKHPTTHQPQAAIDCPDVEVVTKYVPEPYPVYVAPSWKEKIKAGALGAVAIVVLLLMIRLFKR